LPLVLETPRLVERVSALSTIDARQKNFLFHKLVFIVKLGTQRRKKKHVNVQNVNEDKKLKSAIKKFGMHETRFSFLFRRSAPSRHRRGEHVQG
jgi:hypothetical protein